MNALILLDIQNDFMPGGALAVPEGYDVIPVANRLQRHVDLVVATQDWHPADHGSFASSHPGREPYEVIELGGIEQVLWPEHCVQGTRGAGLVAGLEIDRVERVFRKGIDPGIDSYSGFFDNDHVRATGLGEFLKGKGVERVTLCGVATDYCVKFTALYARRLGFETWLAEDGCRGVEVNPGDVRKALEQLDAAGVRSTSSESLASVLRSK